VPPSSTRRSLDKSLLCAAPHNMWLETPTKKQTRTLWRYLARARVPMMIWFSMGLGRNRGRLWSARQVTSTRAPPSGMKRSRRLIPYEDVKTVPNLIHP
jgi:hypothetical protein